MSEYRVRRILIISIHAPPRGATGDLPIKDYLAEFQFTPLREGRHAQGNFIAEVIAFQFTPLREGRPTPPTAALSRRYFNSRPSARGDQEERTGFVIDNISIHAPPRGATATS